ncbi:MAG: hypothetical protein V1835_06030, partial [Candidatus Micrarchaeota archaeon]
KIKTTRKAPAMQKKYSPPAGEYGLFSPEARRSRSKSISAMKKNAPAHPMKAEAKATAKNSNKSAAKSPKHSAPIKHKKR